MEANRNEETDPTMREELDAMRERRGTVENGFDHASGAQPTPSVFHVNEDGRIGAMGWICPVCGSGISPMTPSCPCRQESVVTRSTIGADPVPTQATQAIAEAVKELQNLEDDAPEESDVVAFRKLLSYYEDRSGLENITVVDLVDLVMTDIEQLDALITLSAKRDQELDALVSEKRRLEKRVQELLEGSMKLGSFAPTLTKARALASLLGFEAPPDAEKIGEVIDSAKIQIGMQRDELRALRKHNKELKKSGQELDGVSIGSFDRGMEALHKLAEGINVLDRFTFDAIPSFVDVVTKEIEAGVKARSANSKLCKQVKELKQKIEQNERDENPDYGCGVGEL